MAQSYTNLGGSGPRRSVFKITSTLPLAAGSAGRSMEMLIDGILSATGKPFMTDAEPASGKTLEFELLGLPRVITAYKWYQSATVSPIQFAFEGFNGSTWDTLSTDTISGPGDGVPFEATFSNTTEYQKYRFRETGGSWTDWNIWQVEFKISGVADEVGNRTSTITASTTLTGSQPESNLVDGAYGHDATDSWWASSQSVAGTEIKFQFGTPRVIKYARIETIDYTGDSGTWKWQGSNDGSSWTDIGSPFLWQLTDIGSGEIPAHDLSSNNTAYSYYRMLGSSGTLSNTPYYMEAYFDIGDAAPPPSGDDILPIIIINT